MLRLALVSAVVLALVAPVARAEAPPAGPAQAKRCAKEAKRVTTFKRRMPAQKRRFFRSHRSGKARRAFVRKQARRLRTLRRAHRRCLRAPTPSPSPSPSPAPQPAPPPPPTPGGLPGGPNAPALAAVQDVVTDDALVSDAEVTDGVARTQLELAFRKNATVEEVNALLRRIGGRIVSSRAGVLIAVVEIPDPGSLAALEQLRASLAGDPVLRHARPVFLPSPDELPEHIAFTPTDLAFVRSQLAVRGHAAWNAKAALAGRTPPTFLAADYFGDGPPGLGTDIGTVASDFSNHPVRTSNHGYMVLGIVAGAYDAVGVPTAAAEAVTGLFPARLPVRAADMHSGLTGSVLHDRMLELVENAPGDVVLNTSLSGWPCETVEEAAAYCTEAFARAAGELWVERVRGTDPAQAGVSLEGKFVHATSAGNVEGPGPVGAERNSEWTAAALLGANPLRNTLVVENFTSTTTEPARPACAAASSELGGTVAGVGSPVHSFNSPAVAGTFADGGTSAATPQVAALAAFVWALQPSLSSFQVAGLIERTARPTTCGGGGSVIDAYAAVLATDAFNPARPARRAVLDVADAAGEPGDDGRFDANDLTEMLDGFDDLNGSIDYGSFDLNGDGVTRDGRFDRLDLDVDDSFDTTAQEIGGVTVHYDERTLTDENVLCHSVYSPLWQGSEQERDEALGLERCTDPDLSHTFPDRVRTGESNVLTVTASSLELFDEQGDAMPLEDVHIELTPGTGTTVNAPIGETNADGVYATSATLASGHTTLSVDVAAYDEPGGTLLAEDTITAPLIAAGTVSLEGVHALLTVRAGADDGDQEALSGTWSMSGSAADAGGSASAGGSAQLSQVGGKYTYTGSVTINASAGTGGGSGGVVHTFDVDVSGGEVFFQVIQRIESEQTAYRGCQVNGRPFNSSSGFLGPGIHQITFDCFGGAGPGVPSFSGTYSWEFTIGPL